MSARRKGLKKQKSINFRRADRMPEEIAIMTAMLGLALGTRCADFWLKNWSATPRASVQSVNS